MAYSKHVEEVLSVLRDNTISAVTKGDLDVKVLSLDPYPEETNWVMALANGKKITTDDIEFSDLVIEDNEVRIHLGDYVFHLTKGKAE